MPTSPGERGGGPKSSSAQLAGAVREVLGAGHDSVVWTDCGDELVIHAGAVRVRTEPDAVLVDVPVATDQTGPAVLTVAILLDDAGGGGVTDARPWGRLELADRWGTLLQDAIWSALIAGEAADGPSGVKADV